MPFQKPRILSDGEANTIRGKCLVGHASVEEVMLLLGHFDLVDMKLRGALETLAAALPPKVYTYGAYGENFSRSEPDDIDEYEVVDFKEVLEGEG